jgi:hypothetical protein
LVPVSGQEWKLRKEVDGIKVWTAPRPATKFHQFKATAAVAADMEHLIAVFKDIENTPLWYDRITENKILESPSENEAIYTVVMDMPWPIKDRIAVVKAHIEYEDQQKKVIIYAEHHPYQIDRSGYVYVDDIRSSWILQDLGDGLISIQHEGYMDPSGSIPAWLARSSIEDGPINTIKNLRNYLRHYTK